jgi:GNAT superfamily N-acetyltransferase
MGPHATAPRIAPFDSRFLRDCESLIAALPGWFGIPESNALYLRDLARLPSWVALLGPRLVGAITLEQHAPASFEIHFMAVRPELHRRGIGRALLDHAEAEARARGGRWLHVKTLAPSHKDPGYARTRAFYDARGYSPLFESASLWGPGNPAVVLVKLLP